MSDFISPALALQFDSVGQPIIAAAAFTGLVPPTMDIFVYEGELGEWTRLDGFISIDVVNFPHLDLALNARSEPGVVYFNGAEQLLAYSHREGAEWTRDVVEPNGGLYPALAFDLDGDPWVAYYDSQPALRLARKRKGVWHAADLIVEPAAVTGLSLAFTQNGHLTISFVDRSVTYARTTAPVQ